MATNFIRKYPYNIVKVGTHFFGILEKDTNKMIMKPADKEGEKDKILLFNSYTKALDHVKAINESKKALKPEEKNEKDPLNKKGTFIIRIKQTVTQDYEISANSAREAQKIAEEKYNNNELDPLNDEGEISHEVHWEGEKGVMELTADEVFSYATNVLGINKKLIEEYGVHEDYNENNSKKRNWIYFGIEGSGKDQKKVGEALKNAGFQVEYYKDNGYGYEPEVGDVMEGCGDEIPFVKAYINPAKVKEIKDEVERFEKEIKQDEPEIEDDEVEL